jgi:hypothetical protein
MKTPTPEIEWLKECVRRMDKGQYDDVMVLHIYKIKKILEEVDAGGDANLNTRNHELLAQLSRNEKSRLHWTAARKAVITRQRAEIKRLKELLNTSYGTLTTTNKPGDPMTAIKVEPLLCPKCGQHNFSHPRLGIYHVCP